MRKFLLTLFAVLTATFAMGQKVTLDFTENSWGLPEGSAAKAFETATFSNGTYAVTLTASEDGGYYFNAKDKYLMLGKQGASLQFPKFDFAVGKIVITGRAGASGKTVMNIYVGENEASTATTGSVEPNTYAIAEAYQAAGTAYVLKVASAHNAQITKIEVFQEGEEPGPGPNPGTSIANTPETAYTTSEALDILSSDADLSPNVYVKGTVTTIGELSIDYGNATFFLTDGSKELYIFRAKYLEGTAFTAEDQLKAGDEVIAYGQLKNYVSGETTTPELANCYTYSVNGKTKLDGSGEETKTITVAEAQALTSGTAKISATVYAICKNGAVFGDQTGYIYYYNTGISGLAIGDQVTVEGALSKYGGFNQFTSAATITKTGSASVTYPAAVEMDVDAWVAAPAIQYVKLTGVLSVSGNYYNIVVDGKAAQGSVVGAQDELFKGVANGSTITVEGFAMYTSGSGKYANIVATKVTVDGQGEQIDITNTPETAYSIAKVIEIVDAGKGLEQKVYVKGIISEIVSLNVEKWKRAQYDIVDTEGSDVKVRVYNGYFLEGHDFVANDQIKVGDVVVVYGQLTLYTPKEGDPIYEIAADNFIYSLNGETVDGVSNIQTACQDGAIFDLSGRRVEKAQKGIYIVNGRKFVK